MARGLALTHQEYVERVRKLGITVIGNYIDNKTKIAHRCNGCGREDWMPAPRDVMAGKSYKCINCVQQESKEKGYNRYKAKLAELGIEEMDEYKGCTTKLRHKCPICKNNWMVSPTALLNGVGMCKVCSERLHESVMASILKQVLQNELGAVPEFDVGFKGTKGKPSLYDIYIPCNNTIVECQSQYHDSIDRLKLDYMKAKYVIEKGFKFVSIDCREYTPLKAVQLFLPNMKEIPEYVSVLDYTTIGVSIKKMQSLLDSGMTYKEVGKEIGIKAESVYYYVQRGVIVKPVRQTRLRKHTEIVVQLDMECNYLRKYDLSKIGRQDEGYRRKISVVNACKSTPHMYLGYYWYYEEDYRKLKDGEYSQVTMQ